MTWTPLKGPWTPPPELTGMTIPEICEELLRLRRELAEAQKEIAAWRNGSRPG